MMGKSPEGEEMAPKTIICKYCHQPIDPDKAYFEFDGDPWEYTHIPCYDQAMREGIEAGWQTTILHNGESHEG
jgi:hypothetical protein